MLLRLEWIWWRAAFVPPARASVLPFNLWPSRHPPTHPPGKPPQAALFIDDSLRNINSADGASRVFHVQQQGLTVEDMKHIYHTCSKSRTPMEAAATGAAAAAATTTTADNNDDQATTEGGSAGDATAAAAAAGPPVRYVFLDYDSTVTRPVFLKDINAWAISDKADVCARLTPEQLVEQFGGAERLVLLRKWLGRLAELKVHVHVVSHGRESVIRHQLKATQLLPLFTAIVASDSPPLRLFGGDKGQYIASVLEAAGTSCCCCCCCCCLLFVVCCCCCCCCFSPSSVLSLLSLVLLRRG